MCFQIGALTGCGGDSSSKKDPVVTTISCTHTSYQDVNGVWRYSQTDSKVCKPLANATTCNQNEVLVRVPRSSNIGSGNTGHNNNLNCPIINGVQQCNVGTPFNPHHHPTQNQQWGNNGWNNGNHWNQNLDPNYHTNPSLYTTTCISYNSPSINYVYSSGNYYYIDMGYLNDHVWSYQYERQLSLEETIAVVGIVAVLSWLF
jgi:hypothetical protein